MATRQNQKSKYRVSFKEKYKRPVTWYTNRLSQAKEASNSYKRGRIPHKVSKLNNRTNRFKKIIKWGW